MRRILRREGNPLRQIRRANADPIETPLKQRVNTDKDPLEMYLFVAGGGGAVIGGALGGIVGLNVVMDSKPNSFMELAVTLPVICGFSIACGSLGGAIAGLSMPITLPVYAYTRMRGN